MENNLDKILKSFNPQKVDEEHKKGIINIKEKGFIFKEKEVIQNGYMANKNNFSNGNGPVQNFSGGVGNYNNPNMNFKKETNQNQNNNIRKNEDSNKSNYVPAVKKYNSPKKEIDSSLDEFHLLNALDDIIFEYSKEKQAVNNDDNNKINQIPILVDPFSNELLKNTKPLNTGVSVKMSNVNNISNNQANDDNFVNINLVNTNYNKIKSNNNNNYSNSNSVVNLESVSEQLNTKKLGSNNYTSNIPESSADIYGDDFYLNDEDLENLFMEEQNPQINTMNMRVIDNSSNSNNFNQNNFQINNKNQNNLQNNNFNQSNQNNNFNQSNQNNNFNQSNQNNNFNQSNQNNNFNQSNQNNNFNQSNQNNNFNQSNQYNSNSNSNNQQNQNINPNIQNNKPISLEINNNGTFIEKFCHNHKIADLNEWGRKFDWDDIVENANLRVFGYKTFRPNQREIINASLSGRDIFVCMPTGGGKSLTFQIPAMISDGVTLVVMPLISLIQDQVSAMRGLGVKVLFLNQDGGREAEDNFNSYFLDESEEKCKLMFITPEKISQSPRTMNFLRDLYHKNALDRFCIDEAHCVSQWGREFRPDYLKLKILRKEFPGIPLLAITATAPNIIREDIISQLEMRDCLFFRSSYNRNNLYIEIRNKKDMGDIVANMATFIKKKYPNACGLIYCASRKECEQIAEKLKRDHNLSAHFYHASMNDQLKYSVQERWKNDEIKIIVATIAFGMGINKGDVRFVIHQAMPKSFEGYYQEIGRAGRDGKKSHCILYYNPADRRTSEFLLHKSNLAPMMITQNLRKMTEIIEYCEEYCECRRVIALLYFDERFNRNDCAKMCDNCRKNLVKEEKDVTQECLKILNMLRNCHASNCDMTANQAVDYLRGLKIGKNRKMPHNDNSSGVLKSTSQENLRKIIRRMIVLFKFIDEKLVSAGDKCFAVIVISNEGQEYLRRQNNVKVVITFPRTTSTNNYEVESNAADNNNNKLGTENKKNKKEFIDKNMDKDLDEYNYNSKDDVEFLNKMTGTVNKSKLINEELNIKKKERKYNRSNEVESNPSSNNIMDDKDNKKKNKPILGEEDYGYCTHEQFEELLDKLKIKRREILKEVNKQIESENAADSANKNTFNIINENLITKKLTGEEIFPITGLKELCRKLPILEHELNSNYIFGVGAKFLQKYGQEFLPEIIKHVTVYKISKNEEKFDEVVNNSILHSSKKKVVGFRLLDNTNEKHEKNINQNVIGSMRNMNRSHIKDESSIKSSNSRGISGLNQAHNNIAMFNSMGDKKSEIIIDVNSGMIKADNSEILNDFLRDLDRCSHQNSIEKSQNYMNNNKNKDGGALSNFFDQLDSFDQRDFNNSNNVFSNQRNVSNDIEHEKFNDFNDINNYGEILNPNEEDLHGVSDDEEQNSVEEFNDIAYQVKKMNNQIGKDNKKRKRKDEEDDDEEGAGEKKAKTTKPNNFFKKKAIWNKMNKNKQKKNNNFL